MPQHEAGGVSRDSVRPTADQVSQVQMTPRAVHDAVHDEADHEWAHCDPETGEFAWSRPAHRSARLVGAENPVMSCDLDILVDEAAESGSSQWPDDRCGSWSSGALGWALLK
jgi:hypothetical protein